MKMNKETQDQIHKQAEKCTECGLCMKTSPMLKEFCTSPKKIPSTPANFHQELSFSKLFRTSIKGLGKEGVKRVFFPGCSLMAYSPEIVLKTYDYLRGKLPGIGIMMGCCGKPTRAMGDKKAFQRRYHTLQQEFIKNKVDEVIVACSNCFITIGGNSPQIKIRSLWDVIAQVGIPEEKKDIGKSCPIKFALHDPCPTRKETSIHDSVRKIIGKLGFKIEEMKYSREKTLCCGAGGMLGGTNPSLAIVQMKKRANQAQSDYMLSYCEECVSSMKIGGKKAIHILDLLFDDPKNFKTPFDQANQSTLQRWGNRYRGKRKIEHRGEIL